MVAETGLSWQQVLDMSPAQVAQVLNAALRRTARLNLMAMQSVGLAMGGERSQISRWQNHLLELSRFGMTTS